MAAEWRARTAEEQRLRQAAQTVLKTHPAAWGRAGEHVREIGQPLAVHGDQESVIASLRPSRLQPCTHAALARRG
jgi:hypothetical protein